MGYEPKYAEGQILVGFKGQCSKHFAREFGERVGFEMSEEPYDHGEAYIFKTELGKETEAIEKFLSYDEFVGGACLRDLKMEARWESLDKMIELARSMYDDSSGLPDEQYNQRLDEMIKYLHGLKEVEPEQESS
jgi:hypothetical protein